MFLYLVKTKKPPRNFLVYMETWIYGLDKGLKWPWKEEIG
jgi:hypothetical protein